MMASAQKSPAEGSPNLDQLSFRDKMKFFEKEIKDKSDTQPGKASGKQFSYLAEHEIAKLKQEEDTKTANMSSEQLRDYLARGMADMKPDHDLDRVLSSLNTRRTETVQAVPKQRSQGDPFRRFSQPSNISGARLGLADKDDQINFTGSS